MRVELDDRGESIGRKIREAELRKVPYMLIVGEREQAERAPSSVRRAPRPETPASDRRRRSSPSASRGELYSAALQPAANLTAPRLAFA